VARPRPAELWNHTIGYHRLVLDQLRERASRALDVGCGEGTLARELSFRCDTVTGLDADAATLARARDWCRDRPNVELVEADFLEHDFAGATYSLVACTAALHHMPLEAALLRLRALVAPGGALVILGLARSSRPGDFLADAVGRVLSLWHRRTKRRYEHHAPLARPRESYSQIRRTTERLLADRDFRRLLLFRYLVVYRNEIVMTG